MPQLVTHKIAEQYDIEIYRVRLHAQVEKDKKDISLINNLCDQSWMDINDLGKTPYSVK